MTALRVIAPDVGGGFGAKLIVYPEDVLISLLAMRFGPPVRWLEDRVEHMLTATQERTHVALAEVDPETGRIRILGYWISHDSGRLINPTIVEGQIHGAVALGLGSALFEAVRYDEAGQRLDASFMDSALPRSDDIPPLEIDHLETPSPLNPLGLKGVGESGTLPVPAVVASAVEDAMGVRVEAMPTTSMALRQLLTEAVPTPTSASR